MIIDDEEILAMPYGKLYERAILSAGPGKYADNQLLEKLRFPNGQPQSESTEQTQMKDVTPQWARIEASRDIRHNVNE